MSKAEKYDKLLLKVMKQERYKKLQKKKKKRKGFSKKIVRAATTLSFISSTERSM